MKHSFLPTLLALAACVACSGDDNTPAPVELRGIQAVNATLDTLDVLFDGTLLKSGVVVGEVVPAPTDAASGSHVVRFRRPGLDSAEVSVTIAAGVVTAAIARTTIEGSLFAFELSDTGSAPVAGRSKVSVVHLAEQAPPLDVWRIQPDFADSIRVMFPFPLGAQSGYIESTPGAWTVFATLEGTAGPKLATTGTFDVAGGEVYAVLLLDDPAGGFTAVPIREH
jgi:hypothetical protein